MTLPRHVFREYDIRGVADRDLEDGFVQRVGLALGTTIARERGQGSNVRFAIGRDGRLSSPRIHAALVDGLLSAGVDIVDVGVGPTPMLYFAAHHLATDGAVQITGSHNPGEDNGLKMMRGKGSFFGADITKLRDAMLGDLAPAARRGTLSSRDVTDAYVAEVEKSATRPTKKLRVVVDAGNGAAGPLGVRTLTAMGYEVDPLFCDIDGRFPNHHPDPTQPENVEHLKRRVLETGAPLGIAWDGDGDRIGAVDERGEIIWGDKLMILFARALLRERPGATILGEVKCSETLFDEIRRAGGTALYSKTGHSLIKTRMKQEGALLAGEMSGHIFFADRWLGFDDAIYAAARLLEIVDGASAPLSALLADVAPTVATPELRVTCADDVKFDVVRRVRDHFAATHDVLDIDGARVGFGDGAWGLCRASNTQPVLVLRFEAKSEARLAEIRSEMTEVVRASGADPHATDKHG
jgi:phosphomannomutase/phosphoglucomutase